MNALTTNWRAVRSALADERARQGTRLAIAETAYLPAALEVIERPVSPTARLTAKVMLAGVVLLGAGLALGTTDVVASAAGRVVPTAAVQLVQPAATGIVRRILVHDGDRVAKGQALVMLDPTLTQADVDQATAAWQTSALEEARAHAVLDALDGKGFVFTPPPGIPGAETQRQLALATLADIEASIRVRGAAVATAAAEVSAARTQADKLGKTLPLLEEQVAVQERLLAQGYVTRSRVVEMQRQRISEQHDRDQAVATIQRARAQAGGAASDITKIRADARAQLLDTLVKASADAKLRAAELSKAQQRAAFQVLRAPVAGTVGQLALHTEGGVVEAAKPIMTIVPLHGGLVAEVRLLNRDAGFVTVGQPVQVKIEAFPFSRYGIVPGRVLSISPDAVEDEKLGLVYVVRVAIDRTEIDRGDRRVPLTPGMTATADIVTGSRTFLSYLTSPIESAGKSALRER